MEVVFFLKGQCKGLTGWKEMGGTDFLSKDAGWRNVFRMGVSG